VGGWICSIFGRAADGVGGWVSLDRGDEVGDEVSMPAFSFTGLGVGCLLGISVTGFNAGCSVGLFVTGFGVGFLVGLSVAGFKVGVYVGLEVGVLLGLVVGGPLLIMPDIISNVGAGFGFEGD